MIELRNFMLHSRRRFILLVLLIIGFLILFGQILSSGSQKNLAVEKPLAPIASAPASPSPSVSPSAVPIPSNSTPDPLAINVASDFVAGWAKEPKKMPAWLDGVRNYVTLSLYNALTYTDPARIVATKVTGPAKVIVNDDAGLQARVPTDKGDVIVTVIRENGNWRVQSYLPAM